ncbi:MAG: ABC transporter substrate-binding protein [Chloroflexi bacterium]|nr:ABC transporter substrate-binding protein [Chloroflexota bacterium]
MKKCHILAVALVMAVMALAACRPAASTKEPYKIGMTAALTGPAAGTAGPEAEGFRIYIAKLNDAGGINGRPVQLTIQDDRGEPTQAASNMRKFADMGIHIARNTSMSATFLPTIQEAKRANVPVVFTLAPPTEAMPPTPDPLVYMASHGQSPQSNFLYLDAMKSLTPSPKVGLLAMQIPISLLGIQNLDKEAKRMGIPTLMKVVPADTVDITSVAQAFQEWGANWIYYFGPGAFAPMLFDAMQKTGWKGNLMEQAMGTPFETIEEKYKGNPNVYLSSAYAPFSEDLPPHREIKEAAGKYGAASLNSLAIIGWYDGMVFTEILKKTGWPVTTDKLLATMQNLQVNRSPAMPPLKWTPQDHVGNLSFRIYQWKGNSMVGGGPWFVSDAKGENRSTVKDLKEMK